MGELGTLIPVIVLSLHIHYVPASHKLGPNANVEKGTMMCQLVLELSA